jgi:hypothetical protein
MITEQKHKVADPTAPERMGRYRENMKQRGNVRIEVWVPPDAAEKIRRIAAEMREANK